MLGGGKGVKRVTDQRLMLPLGWVLWRREQDERAERQRQRRERGSSFGDPGSAVDDGMGSFDDGDPYTTNLYVGNLATTVDEEVSTPFLPPPTMSLPSNLPSQYTHMLPHLSREAGHMSSSHLSVAEPNGF